MSCLTVSTIEQATERLPSSVLPIGGLRRDAEGNLTQDALQTILDGVKSRGIDPTDRATRVRLMTDLSILLCSVNNQYQFLMRELTQMVQLQVPIQTQFLNTMKEKNLMMMDILNISRHIEKIPPFDGSSAFIEGWQNGAGAAAGDSAELSSVAQEIDTLKKRLKADRAMLETESFEDLRKHMVDITREKNKVASNYLGLYGFLNIVAVGLLIYIAGASR